MIIIWSEKALKDLERIYEYLVDLNLRAAVDLYNSILDETDILEYHPKAGIIQQLNTKIGFPLRGLLMKNKNFKVIYFIDDYTVYITQVWDCRSNPNKIRTTL